MEIFKKWWFYVIAGAVIVLLPFSIKYALQPTESAAEMAAAGDTASVDTQEGSEAPGSVAPAENGDTGVGAGSGQDSVEGPKDGTAAETDRVDAGGGENIPENPGGEPPDDESAAAEESAVPPEDTGDGGDADTRADGTSGDGGDGEDTDFEGSGAEVTYILNLNSKRFHLPACKSVEEMKEKNRQETSLSREELVADGWVPCGRCKP